MQGTPVLIIRKFGKLVASTSTTIISLGTQIIFCDISIVNLYESPKTKGPILLQEQARNKGPKPFQI